MQNQQISPRSTPSSSSSRGKSPSIETESLGGGVQGMNSFGIDSGMDMSMSMDNSGRQSNLSFNWRHDLLSAADSVTDAMSSLVLEYNAGWVNLNFKLIGVNIKKKLGGVCSRVVLIALTPLTK